MITHEIKVQLEKIRKSGSTNMLDLQAVQWYANQNEFYGLVVAIEDNRAEIIDYMLHHYERVDVEC